MSTTASSPRGESRMTLDEMLGINPTDPVQQHADELVETCYALIEDLSRHRRTQGLSLAQVADRMGISVESAAALERSAGTDMNLSTLRRYALAIGAALTLSVSPWTAQA